MIKELFSILFGALLGTALYFLVSRCIEPVVRAFWRVLHRNGCPLPLNLRRKELLRSYQTRSMGMPWQVEVFDIRATCGRCGRMHRLETKIFTQINPYL